jgi:hypothetical protein
MRRGQREIWWKGKVSTMSKFKSTALVALFAALGAQSIYAQGQSSGEDTQRDKQQRQQQQQQQQQKPSSSGAPGQSSSATSQSSPRDTSSGASGSSQSQLPSSGSTSSSSSSNDAFKSDTSATGRLSSQGSGGQSTTSSSSQGAPGSAQSSSGINTSSSSGRPGDIQTGANVQVNQQHVTQFQNVFSNWRPGANQEQQLTAAIQAAAPSAQINHEFITRFVTDFNTIVPRIHLSTTAQQRLATAFATVLTPSVQVTTLEPTLTDVRQVLVESGLSPIQAQTVACDLHLMAAQVHPDMLEINVK